jgi:hypothetical protein
MLAVVAPTPAEASTLTWTGEAPKGSPDWWEAANWQDSLAPSFPGPVALSFPRLEGAACTSSPPSDSCYDSYDNLGALAVESLSLADGNEYVLEGDPITLGSGGLVAAPAAGTSGPAGDTIGLPIGLEGPQTWSVSGRTGGATGEVGIALTNGVQGKNDPLTVDLSDGAIVYMLGDIETGPLWFARAGDGAESVVDFEGKLNSGNGEPVSVEHALLLGEGSVGPLQVNSGEIAPAGRIETPSMSLDSGSTATFLLEGVIGETVHSELISKGPVDLGGAKLNVEAGPAAAPYGTCP